MSNTPAYPKTGWKTFPETSAEFAHDAEEEKDDGEEPRGWALGSLAEDCVQERPLTAVLISAGIGFLAALALRDRCG